MRKVPIPIAQFLIDLLRGPVALVVWMGAGAGAVWLLLARPLPVTHVAWVPMIVAEVTAPEDGRLEALMVEQGQFVRHGEVLGRLDDAALHARLATELARVDELRARVEAAEVTAEADLARFAQDLELTRADETRRFAGDLLRYRGDEADLALDVLDHEVLRARTALEIERLDVLLVRAQNLVDDSIGPVADVEDLTLEKQQSEAELERLDDLIAGTTAERDAASARLALFLASAPAEVQALVPPDALAGVRAAVLVQERAVDEVEIALGRLELTAPMDGVVQEILRLEGQFVAAAEVVVRVLAPRANEAVLYMDPAIAHGDLVGRKVELRRVGSPETVVESIVATMSPQIELMPERLWVSPDLPRYGRAVRVPVGPPSVFLPGEVLGARLK